MEDTIAILRGLKEKYEIHHGVRITDAAIVAAAELSNRYISDRFLPDKAIDLMDEAASRLRETVAVITRLEEVREKKENIFNRPIGLKIKEKELALICSQFAIILSAEDVHSALCGDGGGPDQEPPHPPDAGEGGRGGDEESNGPGRLFT